VSNLHSNKQERRTTTVQLNCRNFKCNNNKKGECLLERIELVEVSPVIINKVICVEAEWPETDPEPKPARTEPDSIPDQ